ncbi:MAG: 16S rRNA (cytosine(1402)-N(4))-methyltransferase RsmH, partial [Muribaculaceae bacterium]|nr:16S rRNA (cytosine(1402)-N(4))-methyltransferase RsmH [Muribaculaceae bacterium]
EQVYHIPALLQESINSLNIKPDGIYVDATFGGGGHSRAIVDQLSTEGHLYSFDQDRDAIDRAFTDPRMTVVYSNFRFLPNFMRFYGHSDDVDGILADLGVSFHHFDDADRGFSFRFEGPLDMRMNRNASLTAAKLINERDEERLAEIFYLYGELKTSRKIAREIIKARSQKPIETISQLVDIVTPLLDKRQTKKELACVFQALRIVVNDEIDVLRRFLLATAKVLKPGGRLAIITYHSLEDRLVKNFMKTGNLEGKAEKDFYGRNLSPFKPLGGKPIVPTDEEIERNPRSRSAKLRVAEKI